MSLPLLSLISVPFYGDFIQAIQMDDGRIFVNLRRLCEAIGVNYAAQHAKLRSPDCDWACIAMIATHDSSGRCQPTCMIDIDSLPMWLMSIQPSKVAFHVRDKLRIYRREARSVLAAWFNGGTQGRGQRMVELDKALSPKAEIDSIKTELATVTSKLTTVTSELMVVTSELKVVKKESRTANNVALVAKRMVENQGKLIEAILNPNKATKVEFMTVREARDSWKILGSDGRLLPDREFPYVSKTVAALCRATGQTYDKVDDGKGGTVNAYPVGVLAAWKADNDLRSRVTTGTYAKFTQLRLYDKLG